MYNYNIITLAEYSPGKILSALQGNGYYEIHRLSSKYTFVGPLFAVVPLSMEARNGGRVLRESEFLQNPHTIVNLMWFIVMFPAALVS